MFLLDTNIISDIAKNATGHAAQRYLTEPRELLCTSIIVSGEVLFGLTNSPVARKTRLAMLAVLENLQIMPLEEPVDRIYAEIRSGLAKTGRTVGPNDLLIAAQALVLGATVVTADTDFRHVPGLKVENWLRAEPAAH